MYHRPMVLGALFWAHAPNVCAQDLDVSVTAETRYAYGTQSGNSQSAELEIRPAWELTLSDQWLFQGEVRFRTDAFDRLEVGRPDQSSIDPISRRDLIGKTTEIEVREAFFQYADDWTSIRLGKQQIVWGRADGIKVLDIVNPQSFREFILDDFDQSRTPLWSIMVERTILNLDFQVFWIFDQTFNEAPPAGSIFEITAPEFVPTFLPPASHPIAFGAIDKPGNRFGDSEFGFQVSGLVGDWDFSLNYFHTFEDTPFFDLDVRSELLTLTPRFNRVDVLGLSFANAWGHFTLRGEATFTFGENIPIAIQPGVTHAPVEADVAKYVLGIDYVGIPDTFISAQFFQQIRLNKVQQPSAALTPNIEDITTLLVRHDLDDGDWTLELQWLANHDSMDGLIRAHVSHQLDDNAEITIGGDFFYGRDDGVFGQFSEADRIAVTYSHIF